MRAASVCLRLLTLTFGKVVGKSKQRMVCLPVELELT